MESKEEKKGVKKVTKKAEPKKEAKKETKKVASKEVKKEDKKTTTTKKPAEKKAKKEAEVVKENKKEEKTTAKETKEVKIPEARATLKYERISSSKVSIVANEIRGKNATEALAILKFTNKAGARVLYKVLESAMANAVNNHYMNESKLYVYEVYANQGPTLKRFRARAKGSGARILKRTSHITVVLRERD